MQRVHCRERLDRGRIHGMRLKLSQYTSYLDVQFVVAFYSMLNAFLWRIFSDKRKPPSERYNPCRQADNRLRVACDCIPHPFRVTIESSAIIPTYR